MNANQIEAKWQKRWKESQLYAFDKSHPENKKYILEMWPYPSAAKLHVGHWYNYGPADTYARFSRMQGANVFHPQGFDSFGLPAENFAIKTGIHPKDSTMQNIKTMEEQLEAIGASYDWDYEQVSSDEDYYKWTQWIFLQFYKNGLAYRKEAPVNWCPSCQTVLANEQVVEGECERCHTQVLRKNLTQWFFKITAYAEELLSGLDSLEWPEKTKAMQRNWIGKSVGGEVEFTLENSSESFRVFTTRADTLFGCTYVVVAPEHPIVSRITTPEYAEQIAAYQTYAASASEIDRLSTAREKTGAFTGSYAINPVNDRKVPIYVADYVLASYGTGIVMAVPAHDERDFAFATKYNLPIERVIASADGTNDDLPYTDDGILVNSASYNGVGCEQARKKILEQLASKNTGGEKINYRLRDWLVSRQRYWGAPIPIIHCKHCGEVAVPEEQLPVVLPYDVDFRPDGTSPLLRSESFMNVTCPKCGGPAKRDADTMDTFVCSSWYFLRYPNAHNHSVAMDPVWTNKICPVDVYIGGAEHACMHLLYARFFTKALRDLGYLSFDEPFLRLVHQGLILGPDGYKMSKSRGNVVSPDGAVSKYGSDVFRMYLEFGFSFIEGGTWNDDGIKAIVRFAERVERLVEKAVSLKSGPSAEPRTQAAKELHCILHNTIKSVGIDTERFQFNTALARLMELVNALYKYVDQSEFDAAYFTHVMRTLTVLLAPFAPHLSEEWWEMLGQSYSVFNQPWPIFDPNALVQDEIEYGVQINGKVRARIMFAAEADQEALREAALNDETVKQYIGDSVIKKVIVVRNIVNIVVAK